MKKTLLTLLLTICCLTGLYAQEIDFEAYNKPLPAAECDSVQLDQNSQGQWATQSVTARSRNQDNFVESVRYYDAGGILQQAVELVRNSENLVTEATVYYELGNGTLEKYMIYSVAYDGQNRISEYLSKVSDWSGNFKNYMRVTISYDASGNKATENQEYWDGMAFVNNYRTTYTYDASNRLIEKLSESGNGSKWNPENRTTYTYNTSGLLETEQSESYYNGQWMNNSLYEYAYNSNSEQISRIQKYWDQANWLNNALDSNISSNETLTYYWNVRNPSWTLSQRTICANEGTINPPAPPAFVFAYAQSAMNIYIQWYDIAANEKGFIIESSTDSLNWSHLDSLAPNTVTKTHNGLQPETKYHYRVASFNDKGISAWVYATATTHKPAPPEKPYKLEAFPASLISIYLNWYTNSNNHLGFIIERGLDSFNFDVIDTTGFSPYLDENLLTGVTYYYRVSAYNDYGVSEYSNIAFATTEKQEPPAAPTNLIGFPTGSSTVSLGWVDNADNEKGFIIQRSTTGLFWDEIAQTTANTQTYMDNGLQSGLYIYRVAAFNDYGQSDWSNLMPVTIEGKEPPTAPMFLTAMAMSESEISIAWLSLSGATGFIIERSLDEDNWQEIADVATTLFYEDAGLMPDTKYYYRVAAYNSNGNSPWSNTASATTEKASAAPDAPAELTATAYKKQGDGKIYLQWKDNSGNEAGFKIFRSMDNANWTEAGRVIGNVSSYNDDSLENEQTYYYKVLAFNSTGESGFSNIAEVITLTGIASNKVSSLRMYPNPAADKLTLETEPGFSLIRVLDLTGKEVITEPISGNKFTVDISMLNAGTYIIELRGENILAREKLIVQ